jgi:hypothetical protein
LSTCHALCSWQVGQIALVNTQHPTSKMAESIKVTVKKELEIDLDTLQNHCSDDAEKMEKMLNLFQSIEKEDDLFKRENEDLLILLGEITEEDGDSDTRFEIYV